MLQIRHTVIFITFIIVTIDNINCDSAVTDTEIANTTELQIRDDILNGNSSLEARSKNGKKIELEKIETPSDASVSITSPVGRPNESLSQNTEKQSPVPSIDAHSGQDLGAKAKYLKKTLVNDNNLDLKTELYPYNISSSSFFIGNENILDNENEDDYDQDDLDEGNEQENNGKDEGELNKETEVDIRTYGRHGSRGRGRHHTGLRMTKVFMPTGRMASIAVPKQLKRMKCGMPTKLITLNPHGKHGRREYNLVAKEVQLTKRQHSSGQFRYYRFIKIQKVVNGCFWKKYRTRQQEIRFEAKFVNERMLFHGTNKVKDLLKSGFDERYASIHGMFGAGIYFAKHSSKSNQYAFGLNKPCPVHRVKNCDRCQRQMLLCRVTMGKVQKQMNPSQNAHPPPGYNSVEGVPSLFWLQYPEYIVYRGEQVYPEYVITYRIVK